MTGATGTNKVRDEVVVEDDKRKVRWSGRGTLGGTITVNARTHGGGRGDSGSLRVCLLMVRDVVCDSTQVGEIVVQEACDRDCACGACSAGRRWVDKTIPQVPVDHAARLLTFRLRRPLTYTSGWASATSSDTSRSNTPTATMGRPRKKLNPEYMSDSYNEVPEKPVKKE